MTDELIGWRLYYLHRGRLCPPMMGDLRPVGRNQGAKCLQGNRHASPAAGCSCGWRLADNLAAIRPAAETMQVPVRMPPVVARLRKEHPEGADNEWGIPERVLAEWDWPSPALVRVRGHGGVVRSDEVTDHLAVLQSRIERSGKLRVIPEGRGMWRAAQMEIIGPVITGQSPRPYQFHPPADGAGVAERYGVQYHHAARWEWLETLEAVAGGWLPGTRRLLPQRRLRMNTPGFRPW